MKFEKSWVAFFLFFYSKRNKAVVQVGLWG